MKYRKRPERVEAVQWNKNGDHPKVEKYSSQKVAGGCIPEKDAFCSSCGKGADYHGEIYLKHRVGYTMVCPGDWIITDARGKISVVGPDEFARDYEMVLEANSSDSVPQMNWQPMETAPKDGSFMLLYWDDRGMGDFALCHYSTEHNKYIRSSLGGFVESPLLWAPFRLPTEEEVKAAGGRNDLR